jgi:hypothetical protein
MDTFLRNYALHENGENIVKDYSDLGDSEEHSSTNDPAKHTESLKDTLDKTPGMSAKLIFEKRSLPEILELYVKNLGPQKKKRCHRCISQELG